MSRSYATTRYVSSGGGSSYIQPTGGTVDGLNTIFAWSKEPKVIIVDQGRSMQKQNNGGFLTQNWTGTTTTTLLVAPNFDVYGLS